MASEPPVSAPLIYGWVTICGGRFPVTSVWLAGGEVKIRFSVTGPREACAGPVTVYGQDGQGCWQGRVFELPAIPEFTTWIFTYGMRIREVAGANEGEIAPVRFR